MEPTTDKTTDKTTLEQFLRERAVNAPTFRLVAELQAGGSLTIHISQEGNPSDMLSYQVDGNSLKPVTQKQ